MICPNQSNRGPLKEKKEQKEKEKCGSLPPADPSGPVEKQVARGDSIKEKSCEIDDSNNYPKIDTGEFEKFQEKLPNGNFVFISSVK